MLPVQLGHSTAAVPRELEHEEPRGHKWSLKWQGVTSMEERWLAEENREHLLKPTAQRGGLI